MLSAPRLATFHHASRNGRKFTFAAPLKLNSFLFDEGEVRKYVGFNDEIFVRIRTTDRRGVREFREDTIARDAQRTREDTLSTLSRARRDGFHHERIRLAELPRTIHSRTKFTSTLKMHVRNAFVRSE